jgi:hypothetical protein
MRKTVPLRRYLENGLEGYVTTAKANVRATRAAAVIAAVGLSSLGVTPTMNAEIVYTPTDQVMFCDFRTCSSRLYLDLNNDGQVDFNIRLRFGTSFSSFRATEFGFVLASGNGVSNRVMVTSKLVYESALPPGAAIGSRGRFEPGTPIMATCADFFSRGSYFSGGPWGNATNRYLGLRFSIDGEIHYGWARLSVTSGCVYKVTLMGYAYETVPNRQIDAGVLPFANDNSLSPRKEMPVTPTLGELAAGASALAAWRSR